MYLLFFEPRIPLFLWLVLLAVFIKVRNARPCSFSASLTYYRIEVFSKLKLACHYSAICTSLVFTNVLVAHPVSEATVPKTTTSANSFIQLFVLLFRSLQFCFQYQHSYTQLLDLSIAHCLVGCLQKLSKRRLHPALFIPGLKINWSAYPF